MRRLIICLLCLSFSKSFAQTTVTESLAQHNLTQFNASLLSPTYGYSWDTSPSLSVWSRWQFLGITEEPTTVFAKYGFGLGQDSRLGISFFTTSDGLLDRTGGVLNFTQALRLSDSSKLVFGLNLFGFQEEMMGPVLLPGDENGSDFLLQASLGAQLMIKGFSIAASVDNALDYNFTTSERIGNDRLFFGALSYDVPIRMFGSSSSFLRPVAYYRTFSEDIDAQYGMNALFSTPKFWVQGGYNNLYGPSGGLGFTFFKRLSIGGLIELPIDEQFENEDPTFEVQLAYRFGKNQPEEELEEEEEEESEEDDATEEKEAEEAAQLQREADSLRQVQLEERRRFVQDSTNTANKKREETLMIEKARLDSIAKQKELENRAKEEEEEIYVSEVEGLDSGYYLIANVYATEKYFNKFMATLRRRGLNPKSFYRPINGYKYVYLERYDTMEAALKARNGKFSGRYTERLWIFHSL